ncbi:S8 family serine peptidase [Deinococcus koreensis]|uniref:Serine protease n=1 Tax=Deinococcus koreensis TaxID=2054903 RepID=A0A2K3UZP8_9DEIO|nr:S8 family serine peptidase [Deinococcus koreensis]PNY82004.1 serine protease [Deinococcus koreensis]
MHKNIFKHVGLVGLTALLAACSQQGTPSRAGALKPALNENGAVAQLGQLKYIQNELVVGYSDPEALNRVANVLGGSVVATIPEIRVGLVRFNGDAAKSSGQVFRLPGVRYAQPNLLVRGESPQPGVGTAALQAQAASADQVFDELPQYALDPRHLNARAAWDAGLTGAGVKVAVLDDPGDVTHPDLAPNWSGVAYNPFLNKVYTSGAEWVADYESDFASHGTFVASSIVAPKDGKGIVGVAPQAKFMPVVINPAVKAINEFYSDFYIARGAVWASNNGARVLNNSWGGGLSFGPIKDAFDYAMSNGTVVVASMGNSYHDEFQYPAALPGVIASGALDGSNRKVTFSTTGRHISSGAPGQDVMLANPTWLGGGHELISGTSFSSPYTAGVAALVLQKCPSATPYQVRRVMETTANSSVGSNPTGFDRDTGWGALDAGKIAATLKSCASLPAKGAYVNINVKYVDNQGTHPGVLGDVMLRGQGFRAGATDDPTPLYLSTTDAEGNGRFAEIAPGTYDVYVAGSDLSLTGGLPEERGTYVGTLSATAGSSATAPDQKNVLLTAQFPNFNPVDPYEPNDTPAEAKTIAYGQTTQTAYIFGQPQDADFFKFTAAAGDKIAANVLAAGELGGTLDSYLFLIGPDGKTVLSENDDRGTPRIDSDSEILYTIQTAGTYYLKVSSCTISCNPKSPQDDDSPFNKYQLKLQKQ